MDANGVAAAGGEVVGRIRPFRWWIRGKTAAGVENPARRGQANDGRTTRLRTPVRCAIIGFIAQLLRSEITLEIPPPETRP